MTTKLLCPAKVKAGEDTGLATGEFEALVSVFGNVDSMGDRVIPGAFTKSLTEWGERGKPIPVIWTHSHGNAFDYIGEVNEAEEHDGEGLWVKGTLDVADAAENATARQVYRLLKGGRIDNWSFAYDVIEEAPGDDGVNELRQLKVYEVGPTLIGANQDTRTLAVKTNTKETVSDKPWSDFPDSAFDDQQYARACILDRGSDAGTAKQRYSLPVREPDGTLNRNACHNAAAVLAGGRGGVQASDEQKRAAARKLAALYRQQLDEDVPEAVADLTATSSSTAHVDVKLGDLPELASVLELATRVVAILESARDGSQVPHETTPAEGLSRARRLQADLLTQQSTDLT